MKALIKPETRYGVLIFVAIILTVVGIISIVNNGQTIEKKPLAVSVDRELKQDFEEIANYKLNDYYNISFSDSFEKSDVIMTSYLDKIDKSKERDMIAYSPLVVVMNDTSELNNLRISENKNGFLISEQKIRNTKSDAVFCDFKKVVEAIISGANWSHLGGPEDKQIKIYCPSLTTREGELFKEFLVRTYNNGSKISNEEIDAKIQKFFDSDNVIQTDIISKLEIIKDNISPYDLFVGFEYQFLEYCLNVGTNSHKELSFIYPETTILKQIYLQYDGENKELKNLLYKNSFFENIGIKYQFYYQSYREGLDYFDGDITSNAQSYNIQDGIIAFETN